MRAILRLLVILTVLSGVLIAGAMGVGAAFPGDEIAFHDRAGPRVYQARILDVRTGLQRLVYESLPSSFAPAWSPDGTRIAFLTIQGSEPIPVVLCIVETTGSNLRCVNRGTSRVARPTWSPDGTRIAFVREDGIQIAESNALERPPLSLHVASSAGPAWSPDGARIAYVLVNENDTVNIYLLNLHTRESRWLAEGVSPVWSPDGTHIAYTRDFQVMVIAADGGTPAYIAEGYSPAWSPDGQSLVFSRDSETATSLIVYDLNTGRETTLIANGQAIFGANWRPR